MSDNLKPLAKSLKQEFPSILKEFEAQFPIIADDLRRVIKEGYFGRLNQNIGERLQTMFEYNAAPRLHASTIG